MANVAQSSAFASTTYFSFKREELLPFILHPPNVVLEVGCGYGLFGESLIHRYGSHVTGIEPDQVAFSNAKARLSHVIHGRIEELLPDLQDGHFDAIFLNDVLEHLYDPAMVLFALKAKLTPSGLIYTSIPNLIHYQVVLDLLLKRDFIYEAAGILDYSHIRWFTKKGILRLFSDVGLNVQLQVGINPTPSRLQRLISFLSLGYYEETKYPQFLTIGSK